MITTWEFFLKNNNKSTVIFHTIFDHIDIPRFKNLEILGTAWYQARNLNNAVEVLESAAKKADNGNLYSYSGSTTLAGYYPAATKPSGILKINNDTQDFDEDFFINITEKTGNLVSIKEVIDSDDLMIINKSGITIRLAVSDLRVMGRATQGVKLINIKESDSIAAVAKVQQEEEELPNLEGLGEEEEDLAQVHAELQREIEEID